MGQIDLKRIQGPHYFEDLAHSFADQKRAIQMTNDEKAIHAAVDRWIVALNAMFEGDPEPFAELYSHADDVTYMGAEGTYCVGWDAAYDDWKKQAEKSLGGEVHATEIHVIIDGKMATATHYTKGAITTAEGETVEQQVRETSVFRKEQDVWKMVAHQADYYPVWAGVLKG